MSIARQRISGLQPGYPVINIGPWGRDYHHWLERLHTPYAFEILPRLLLKVLSQMADSD